MPKFVGFYLLDDNTRIKPTPSPSKQAAADALMLFAGHPAKTKAPEMRDPQLEAAGLYCDERLPQDPSEENQPIFCPQQSSDSDEKRDRRKEALDRIFGPS